jgi:hypothetical protein
VKVGDLVRRTDKGLTIRGVPRKGFRVNLGVGIVVSLQLGGSNPVHPTATVFWFGMEKHYKIAESLLEVVSATR